MSQNPAVLIEWIEICLIIAAVSTTAFPLLYAFSPWFRHPVGRALMLQSIAFALVIDLTTLFRFWAPEDIWVRFWISTFVLSAVAGASAFLTWNLWKTNYRPSEPKEKKWHIWNRLKRIGPRVRS